MVNDVYWNWRLQDDMMIYWSQVKKFFILLSPWLYFTETNLDVQFDSGILSTYFWSFIILTTWNCLHKQSFG